MLRCLAGDGAEDGPLRAVESERETGFEGCGRGFVDGRTVNASKKSFLLARVMVDLTLRSRT